MVPIFVPVFFVYQSPVYRKTDSSLETTSVCVCGGGGGRGRGGGGGGGRGVLAV